MIEKEIQKLIDRYLEGITTPEEERQLAHELLRVDTPEKWQAIRLMLGELAMGEVEYDDIMESRQKKTPVITMCRRWIAVAASLLLIIGIGATLWQNSNDNETAPETLVVKVDTIKTNLQQKVEDVKKQPLEMKKNAETVDSAKIIKEQYRMPRPPKHYMAKAEMPEPEYIDKEEQEESAEEEEMRRMEMEMMAQMQGSLQADFMEMTNEIRQRGERVSQRVEMALND
ncbi:hypothetical protein [uncultured Prevotella sp.]|uniref:hypothetical protein n=1 Tax=uncultured Prevotella sp. TaxID=159272 RepID=UPI0025E1E199|nr:hypothetical protein [uncultured Prevotella sp.]